MTPPTAHTPTFAGLDSPFERALTRLFCFVVLTGAGLHQVVEGLLTTAQDALTPGTAARLAR